MPCLVAVACGLMSDTGYHATRSSRRVENTRWLAANETNGRFGDTAFDGLKKGLEYDGSNEEKVRVKLSAFDAVAPVQGVHS
jgi:hypothetical protein